MIAQHLMRLLMGAETAAPGAAFNAFATSLNPTHWYKANEASGTLANTGSAGTPAATATNTPVYLQSVGGFAGVDLSGTPAPVYFSMSPTLTDNAPFSMFAMVHSYALPASGKAHIIAHTGVSGSSMFSEGFLLAIDSNAGSIYTMLAVSSGTRQQISTATGIYSAGVPQTVGYTYTGTTCKVFVNGVLRGSASYSSGVDHHTMRWGHHLGNADIDRSGLNGKTSNLLWWNNTTISDADHAQLHTDTGF